MVQSIPLFSLSTEWRAGGPHWHFKWSRRPTLTVAVHCAYFVSPALALQVEPKRPTPRVVKCPLCVVWVRGALYLHNLIETNKRTHLHVKIC